MLLHVVTTSSYFSAEKTVLHHIFCESSFLIIERQSRDYKIQTEELSSGVSPA